MYYQLYENDTPENRELFLNNWIRVEFEKSQEPYYRMSAQTIAVNFSRLECEVTQDQVKEAFINNGFNIFQKGEHVYFDISPESLGVREILDSWN